jgi:hypothetical protein
MIINYTANQHLANQAFGIKAEMEVSPVGEAQLQVFFDCKDYLENDFADFLNRKEATE